MGVGAQGDIRAVVQEDVPAAELHPNQTPHRSNRQTLQNKAKPNNAKVRTTNSAQSLESINDNVFWGICGRILHSGEFNKNS